MARNPLRMDPTRTGIIRRGFCGDITRRMNNLRKACWKYVFEDDELGFDGPALTGNARRFVFETSDQKLKKFNRWFKKQVDEGVLEVNPASGDPKGAKPWTAKYVDSAYKKGNLRAFVDVKGPKVDEKQPFYQGTKRQFLESSFGQPERVEKLRLLYTRSFENLKGVTNEMSTKMSRVLADGMAHGKGAREIARELSKTVSGLTKERALRIARTEIVNAHAEGQLDSLEEMGIEEVGADVEFTTAGDGSVCGKCQSLEGEVYTIAEARGVIPVHPNCRCAWKPHVKLPKGRKPVR